MARLEKEQDDKAYRIYLTDALYALVNRDMRLTKRFCDILNPQPEETEEDVQAIIDRIRAKLEE